MSRNRQLTGARPSLGKRARYRAATLVPQEVPALCTAVIVEVGLRVSTLPRLANRLGIRVAEDAGFVPAAEPVTLPRWTQSRVVAARRVLRRWPFGDTCLRQCLVVGFRLRKLDPLMRIGVRIEDDGRPLAHSWLEIDGRSIDPSAGLFLPFEAPE